MKIMKKKLNFLNIYSKNIHSINLLDYKKFSLKKIEIKQQELLFVLLLTAIKAEIWKFFYFKGLKNILQNCLWIDYVQKKEKMKKSKAKIILK